MENEITCTEFRMLMNFVFRCHVFTTSQKISDPPKGTILGRQGQL